jgi:flagellar export protein FliJ
MSLDALRALRARAEEALMMELARITRDMTDLETRCATMESELHAAAASYRAETERGVAIEAALEWQARIDAHGASLAQARQARHALDEAWNDVQAKLVEAGVERKILDRLADRRQRQRRAEADRRTLQELDDIANRLHHVRGMGA